MRFGFEFGLGDGALIGLCFGLQSLWALLKEFDVLKAGENVASKALLLVYPVEREMTQS